MAGGQGAHWEFREMANVTEHRSPTCQVSTSTMPYGQAMVLSFVNFIMLLDI